MMNGDRYGGLNVDGGLKNERGCVLLNEGEQEKQRIFSFEIFFFFWLMGWHGHATTGTGRANLLENEGFFFLKEFFFFGCGGFGFWSTTSNFFRFFASYLDKYLQNKLKQHKTNKIKAIKLVGCLPRSAHLKSLA